MRERRSIDIGSIRATGEEVLRKINERGDDIVDSWEADRRKAGSSHRERHLKKSQSTFFTDDSFTFSSSDSSDDESCSASVQMRATDRERRERRERSLQRRKALAELSRLKDRIVRTMSGEATPVPWKPTRPLLLQDHLCHSRSNNSNMCIDVKAIYDDAITPYSPPSSTDEEEEESSPASGRSIPDVVSTQSGGGEGKRGGTSSHHGTKSNSNGASNTVRGLAMGDLRQAMSTLNNADLSHTMKEKQLGHLLHRLESHLEHFMGNSNRSTTKGGVRGNHSKEERHCDEDAGLASSVKKEIDRDDGERKSLGPEGRGDDACAALAFVERPSSRAVTSSSSCSSGRSTDSGGNDCKPVPVLSDHFDSNEKARRSRELLLQRRSWDQLWQSREGSILERALAPASPLPLVSTKDSPSKDFKDVNIGSPNPPPPPRPDSSEKVNDPTTDSSNRNERGGVEVTKKGISLEIIKTLGRGSSAVVYLAYLRTPDTPQECRGELIAVKQLIVAGNRRHKAMSDMIDKEIKMLRRLRHPNIVSYRGVRIKKKERLYDILLEYMDGGSLASRVKEGGKMTVQEARRIVTQILHGLAYLHSEGIIHRDIKPANILLNLKGEVKITDFDVSTQVVGIKTMQRSCVGTPSYTAPEVILGEPYAYSADIWSLGCTLLELYTGNRPYHTKGVLGALQSMVNDDTPPLPDIPAGDVEGGQLLDFLKCCFERQTNNRPSAVDLLEHPFITGS